jgi:hypothetical protein
VSATAVPGSVLPVMLRSVASMTPLAPIVLITGWLGTGMGNTIKIAKQYLVRFWLTYG